MCFLQMFVVCFLKFEFEDRSRVGSIRCTNSVVFVSPVLLAISVFLDFEIQCLGVLGLVEVLSRGTVLLIVPDDPKLFGDLFMHGGVRSHGVCLGFPFRRHIGEGS